MPELPKPSLRAGMIPFRIELENGKIRVYWADLGPEPFRDPFFGRTLEKRLGQEGQEALISGYETLERFAQLSPGMEPSGFISHVSRCGSTLVSRMLSTLDRIVVISEPTLIGQIVALDEREVPYAKKVCLMRLALTAMGQRRRRDETHFVIKLNSANILYLPLLQEAFPSVPWIYLNRNPIEVLVSVLDRPLGWLDRKRAGDPLPLPGRSVEELTQMSDEEYCVLAVAAFGQQALDGLERHPESGRVFDYHQLPGALRDIAEAFDLQVDEGELATMLEVSRFYSKNSATQQVFVADTAQKQARASDSLRQLCHLWIDGIQDQLKAARVAT